MSESPPVAAAARIADERRRSKREEKGKDAIFFQREGEDGDEGRDLGGLNRMMEGL